MIYVLILALTISVILNIYQKTESTKWKEKYWAENRLNFTPPIQEPESVLEDKQTTFVQRTELTRATAETYKNVFDLDINGQRVLEDLTRRFCKTTYVRGGHDAERESCFRSGQNSIPQFIINQITRANEPNYTEELDND
ncbi:hypothetical protein NCZ17_00810 [Acinetobacter modestus]|uniref:Bbp19 family protein n=1 Tax=Acinetobacter modestus TaxID=1776740 RepID=UPI00202F5F9D|nr:hypothetical protein [Acinetobacter modestus]MCM1957911.1 hypothetical protein [Acinetobacter modestus]